MEMSKLRLKGAPKRGFTLIETLVAMFILCVGLVALASLAAQTLSGTTRTHYSALTADLASEKLEDLSRWPTFDPNIYAAPGTTVGGLASDQSASVTSGGIPTPSSCTVAVTRFPERPRRIWMRPLGRASRMACSALLMRFRKI